MALNTIFKVTSSRVNKIEVEKGTTVGVLRRILSQAGYDVLNAKVTVVRPGSTNIQNGTGINDYVLQEYDRVSFETKENRQAVGVDILLNDISGVDAKKAAQKGAQQAKESCCCCHTPAKTVSVEGVTITREGDAIIVKIER